MELGDTESPLSYFLRPIKDRSDFFVAGFFSSSNVTFFCEALDADDLADDLLASFLVDN